MAEALAAAGLTHVRYGAGEQVPWDPGLFLLEVASGEVEGWVRSLAAIPEEEREPQATAPAIAISPSNRFLSFAGGLYDRQTERAYSIDGGLAGWWGSGSAERLLFRHGRVDTYVVVDSDLEPWRSSGSRPGSASLAPLAATSSCARGGRVERSISWTSRTRRTPGYTLGRFHGSRLERRSGWIS